jgi:hypothetical protein
MSFKETWRTLCAAAFMVLASASASANIVLDDWQLWTPTGVTTHIGRLNLVGGSFTVQQEVDGTGNAFVGSEFSEFGTIFSVTFTPENAVGAGDSSGPGILSDSLVLTFSNVMGTVTALNAGGGFHYVFDSGSFVMSGIGGNYASGSLVGSGGDATSTFGFTGDSTMLERIASILNLNFDLRDNAGISLKPDLATGNVLFEAVTHNTTTALIGVGACTFRTDARCISRSVASTGEGYLVRTTASVPEPASLALVGFGLLALRTARRRSRESVNG